VPVFEGFFVACLTDNDSSNDFWCEGPAFKLKWMLPILMDFGQIERDKNRKKTVKI